MICSLYKRLLIKLAQKGFNTSRIQQRIINKQLNLGCGALPLKGYSNLDIGGGDHIINLAMHPIPCDDNSINTVVSTSFINYLPFNASVRLVKEVHRVLKPGGITRFSVQDLHLFCQKYINRDQAFFSSTESINRIPIKASTGMLFNQWFFGHETPGGNCKQFYDYETLASIFTYAGFSKVKRMNAFQSAIKDIHQIDNRPEQMFFLEAVK